MTSHIDWIPVTEDNLPPEDETVYLFVHDPNHFTGWAWKSQEVGHRRGESWIYGETWEQISESLVTHFAYLAPNPDGSIDNPVNQNDSRLACKCPACGALPGGDCIDNGALDVHASGDIGAFLASAESIPT